MEVSQVGVSQGLIDSQSILRIEHQHFPNQVESLLVHLREESREGSFLDVADLVDAL